MKSRALLHILVCYLLLFSAGITNLAADTISHPLSIAVPTGMNGELDTKPVSIAIPTGMSGELDTKPVSVAIPTGMSGELDTKPVTVSVQPENLGDPDLIGLWHMDGDWTDSSGNNNTGVPISGPTFTTDNHGGTQAASLNGSSSFIQVADSASLDLTAAMTLEAWIKPSDISTYRQIVSKFGSSGNYAYQFGLAPSGNLRVDISGNGTAYDFLVTTNAPITANVWNHVAATFNAGILNLYVNGISVIQAKTSTISSLKVGTTPINIGRDPSGIEYFSGLIDEVAIYKRALTAEEIAFHANAFPGDPSAPPSPGLDPLPAVVGANIISALSGTKAIGTSIWVNNKKVAPLDNLETWQGTYGTLQPGTNLLNVVAVDAAFKQSPPVSKSVFYDNMPPVIESSYPTNNSDTAKPVTAVTINLKDTYSSIDLDASKVGATVKNSALQTVSGTWSKSGTKTIIFTPSTTPLPSDSYLVTIFPVDGVGNSAQQQIAFTTHDISAPVTTVSLSGTKGNDGWYSTPVVITLNASDGTEGSGVAKTEYSFDGFTWQLYSIPFTIDHDGVNALSYRSTDKAGNIETPAKSNDIKINKTGLVGLWHMDNDWQDYSLIGNYGTPYSGATFSTTAKIGTYSGSFDGVNDYVVAGSGAYTAAPETFTIMLWAYPTATRTVTSESNSGVSGTSGQRYAIGPQWGGDADAGAGISVGTNGISVFEHGASYMPSPLVYNVSLSGWYHIAVVYENKQPRLYLNGQFIKNGLTSLRGNVYASMTFGNIATYGPYQGLLDEVSIYNRALSLTEIQENYRSYSIQMPTVASVQTPTTSSTITLSGTKAANTAIVLNGQTIVSLGTVTAWQAPYTLQPGMNNLNITAMDVDGFHSQAVVVPVALDLGAPTVTSTDPVNNGLFNTSVGSITFNLTEPFSTIDLDATLSGASVIKTSGPDPAGSWTTSGGGSTATIKFTPASSLAEGTYTATINPTDTLGNHSTYSITFTVDATPPPSPTIDPILLPSRTTTKTITGKKSPDTVRVVPSCSGATFGAVTYTSLTWSVTVSGLHEGSNTITAYAVDAATNPSSQTQMTFTVDTIPPAVPVVNPFVTPTKLSSITLTGTKEANSYLFVNNVKTEASFTVNAWSYAANLPSEGNNAFVFFAQDEAGNPSTSITANVVRDNTGPRISTTTPAFNAFINQLGSVDIILVDDNSAVDLQESIKNNEIKYSSNTVINGSWTTQAGGHIIFTPTPGTVLSNGVYTVTIKPVDVLGNTTTLSFSFTLDTTTPTVQSVTMNLASPHKAEAVTFTITFSEDMLTAVQPSVVITGGASNATYPLSGSWTSNPKIWQGSYTFTTSTGDGTYTLKATGAKDKAQNTIPDYTATDLFVLDTTPPAAPTVNAVTTPTKIANQVLSGTKNTNTTIVINSTPRVTLDTNITDTITAWTFSYPLSENTNTLSVVCRDAAGNDSLATNPKPVIVLDTTPPFFTINTYPNPCSSPTVTLSGQKEPGCIVKKCVNSVCEQIFGPDDSSQTWSYAVTLVSGITNHFVFTAADALSNTTTKTADILYDNAPPTALGPGVLTADGSGKGNEVTLSWAAYPEPTDVSYYAVYKSSSAFTDVAGMTPIGTANKGVKTYKVTGLSLGITYYFAVVPVDSAGNKTTGVYTVSAIPTDTVAPEEVTNLAATAGYSGAQVNTVALTWTASLNSIGDLADQFLYFDSGTGYDSGISIGKTVTTYTKTGLADATKYKFKITVKDTLGHESQGVVIEAVTRLANPTNLSTAPASGKVVLNWSAVNSSYVKQYNLYRKTTTAQQTDISIMTLVGTVAKTVTTYSDTSLTNGTTYQYAVTVLNTSGAERTDVQSVSATPRSDSTGPVIDSFNIIAGQIITAPITISATAHDLESAMGSLELSVDGTVVATQSGGSISFFWNAVASTDGNHIIKIKAVDSLGNATEDPRQVIVSLAPPAIPLITGKVVTQTTPTYTVTVSGTAPLFTTVTLKVNGTVVNTTQTAGTTGTGTFSFSSIALTEGDNLLAVKASHRGGDSAYAPDYKITVDTGAPSAPRSLAAQVLTGGLVRFTWANAAGETPSGYNLYVGTSSFTSTSGAVKANTQLITYLLKEYNPADDGLKYYAVTSLDSAGNESGISNVVAVSTDRVFPSVLGIQYSQNSQAIAPNAAVGKGSVNVDVTISEKLSELPFFSLEPQEGTPIVVSMTRVDDTHYSGSFVITDLSAQGPTTYKFSGKDMVGNRGNAQGTGVTIDVQGPVAAVQSPLTTLQITPNPVAVNLVLNEPSTTTPSLSLKATGGTTALVSGMTSTDNGIHWTGSLDVSSMPEGKAEFIIAAAQDTLGNIGSTVSNGRYIVLYRNGVPPPGIPDGLAAKSGMGGAVTLTWYPVSNPNADLSTLTYNLYRRADGETTPTKVQTGIGSGTQNATTTQDTPPADGAYYYSVTSVGLLGSESPASAEVQAVSDRTGPPAPMNLILVLTGSGVSATWNAVIDTESPLPLKGYNLYRSNIPITSTTGLTPIVKSAINTTVDTSPSRTYRYYAVAAVDNLGNVGPLSDSIDIDFPVSPVRNLVFARIDTAAPTITWQAPVDSGSISGYYIYRNRSRIIDYPVPNLSYTDGYYTSGTIYGISAVDSLGNESPVLEVSVPDLTLGIKDGTSLRRGLLETVPIVISNAGSGVQGSGSLTIDSVDVKVGTAPISSIQGPFDLGANTTLELEKVAATMADAQSPVSVFIQANWSPSPGVTVKLSHTVAAEVLGSSSSLEIFNDPLVRNTDAKVRLKVNNIGSAQMEIVTSENNAKTTKVRINLKDQDGNLLSTGYLDQRIGNAIVNGAGYAVARLDPNTSMTTEPITLPVPASAPTAVIIEAVIDNTYYHYAKVDQVTAPGINGTAATTIQDTAYRASALPDKTFYAMAQPVLITGSAISNDPAAQGALVPNVPVKIGISVRGFDRFATVTTDSTGNFAYTFTPASNEAGDYSVWAVHPDVKDRTVQATFSIAGMSISPTTANVTMARSRTLDIPATIQNYGGGSLTGLTFQTTASSGISVGVINNGDTILTAGEKQSVTFRISTDASAPATGSATMTARTVEGLSVTLNANINIVDLIPIISTSPSYIDTGMVRGSQKVASFTITNTGQDTLRNARIEGPSTSWMVPTINKAIGDVAPGASTTVGFMFSPPDTLTQGVYDDQVVIYSDNRSPYIYHIQVTVTSNAVGSVYFDVQNILSEKVPNATITFQNQLLPELLYTVKTITDGTASQYDIPEGRYNYTVSPPPGHLPYGGSFVITPGTTTTIPITLEVKLVDVSWSVVPTTIQDQYEIQVTQTFTTNVPWPVLVTEPPVINLPVMQPGEVFNGEFTVTNHGLIAAENMKVSYPASFLDYDIDVFTSAMPSRIAAQEKITVPIRITKRQVTASTQESGVSSLYACNSELTTHYASLITDVAGYGAGCVTTSPPVNCSGTGTCANGTTLPVGSGCVISAPFNCPSPTTNPGSVITQPITQGYGGGGSGGSGSGGLPTAGTGITVNPGDPCSGCAPDGAQGKDDGNGNTCDVCQNHATHNGGSEIHPLSPSQTDIKIDADGSMPTMNFSADNTGDISPTSMAWEFAMVNSPGGSLCSFDGKGSQNSFSPSFSNGSVGGDFRLTMTPKFYNCSPPQTYTPPLVKVKGQEPSSLDDIQAECQKYNDPNDQVVAIGDVAFTYVICRESHYKQFKPDGSPLHDAMGGYGLMQVTPPTSCDQIWNWKKNIEKGMEKLQDAYDMALDTLSRKPYLYTPQELLNEILAYYNNGGRASYYIEGDVKDAQGNIVKGWVRQNTRCNDGCLIDGQTGATNGTSPDGICIRSGICYADHPCPGGWPQ